MEVFRSNSVVITYDKVRNRLTQKWFGFPASEVFRLAIDKSVEFSEFNPVYTLLSDTTFQEIIVQQDAEYAASVMPQLVNNGLKAFAFVLSGKETTRVAVNHFTHTEVTNLTRKFADLEKANEWLDSVGV